MDVGRSIFRAIADFSGIRREARSTGAELQKMQRIAAISGNLAGKKFATGFIKGLLKLALIAPIIAAISAAALSGAASLLTLASSLSSVLGLGVAAPAVIGGLVVGVAALGMALKDTKKYLGDLAPGFAAVQRSVSAKFWESAAKPIRSMVQTLLPELKTGLTGVGGAWGTVAAAGANSMKAALAGGPLKKMMEDTRVGIAGLAPAMWPIVHSLTTLGSVGTTYLPQLSAWIVKLAERFDRFIETAKQTGKLDEWLKGGVQALKDLWSIGKSVGGIFGALTKAAQASGANSTLTTLATGLERISNMMNGPAFQKAMTTIFTGANAGAEGLLKSLGPVGDAFERGAPALAKFLELGGEIVGILIGGLADALSNPAFGAGLIAFMEGVKLGVEALAPILPVISTAFGALLAALAPVIATLLPSLGATVAVLAGAFAAMMPVLMPILVALAAMAPVLVPVGIGLMAIYKAMMFWSQMKAIIAIVKGMAAAQWLWNFALAANPIGLIILAIAALVAGLIWFFTQTELGRQIWGGFMNWLKEIIDGFLVWWTGTFWPGVESVFTAIGAIVGILVGIWTAAWSAVWNAVMSFGAMIIGFIASIPGTVIGWLMGLAILGALAWEWFMGMLNSAMTAGGQLLAWVGGLPGQILGMLGNLGALLLGAGQSLIQGFIDGISSMIGAVGAAVGGVMDFIGGFFPASPAKRGAFSGKGWTPFRGKALMSGFATGIVEDGTAATAADAAMGKIASTMTLDPKKLMAPSYATSAALKGQAPVNSNAAATSLAPAPSAGDRNLNVTVNNPVPEAPSQSIQKTYSKVAYLGLDAKETVGV